MLRAVPHDCFARPRGIRCVPLQCNSGDQPPCRFGALTPLAAFSQKGIAMLGLIALLVFLQAGLHPSLVSSIGQLAAQEPGTDEGVSAEEIQKTFERYGKADLTRAWRGATVLEAYGDAAINPARQALIEGTSVQQLMAAKTLISLGEKDKVADVLRAIAVDEAIADDSRSAALQLLASFPSTKTRKLLKEFLAREGAFQAELRIQAAKTLFRTDRDKQARKSLLPLLEVDDANARQQTALALGEMGYVEGRCRSILSGLALEPSADGIRARLIIDNDRLMQRLLQSPALGGAGSSTTDRRKVAKLERELEKKDEELKDLKRSFKRSDPFPLISNLLEQVQELYEDPEKVDKKKLLLAAAKGMVASLDPFSSFMDPKDTEGFGEEISGNYAGIGAQVGKNTENRTLEILRPIYKGPAYDAGMRSGDRIVEVEGLSTGELELDEIIKKLKGAPGTPVTLQVLRRGWDEPREFTITRRTIRLDSVQQRMLPGNIGYISLSQFGDTAVDEFVAAVDALENEGMKALVFDLRNNPGGYLQAAVDIVDEFVGKRDEPVVSQRSRSGSFPDDAKRTTGRKRSDYPLIVLVNGASASASEIVSGAFQDFGRATVVGQRTYGKGSVQRLLPMPRALEEYLGGESRLRLTVQLYYLPSGRSIHAKRDSNGKIIEKGGVLPDVVIAPEELPLWRLEALGAFLETQGVEKYLDKFYADNQQLFRRIAEIGDQGNTSLYPEFDSFFKPLNTSNANLDDIRFELRNRIRRRVEDERGKEFACDLGDDVQLQKAILLALQAIKSDVSKLSEYQGLVERVAKVEAKASKKK